MPRYFFLSACPSCRFPNQIDVRNLGKSTECTRCSAGFVSKSADSQSAALDSPMGYWTRYTAGLGAEEASAQAPKDLSRIPK
jgi:hypothetical protein